MKQREYISYENYLRSLDFEKYKPSLKRWVVFIGGVAICLCLVTPATNWLIPFVIKGVFKYG